jgi:hypothetical protein
MLLGAEVYTRWLLLLLLLGGCGPTRRGPGLEAEDWWLVLLLALLLVPPPLGAASGGVPATGCGPCLAPVGSGGGVGVGPGTAGPGSGTSPMPDTVAAGAPPHPRCCPEMVTLGSSHVPENRAAEGGVWGDSASPQGPPWPLLPAPAPDGVPRRVGCGGAAKSPAVPLVLPGTVMRSGPEWNMGRWVGGASRPPCCCCCSAEGCPVPLARPTSGSKPTVPL